MNKPRYRLLRKGETIREGDEALVVTWVYTNCAGGKVRNSAGTNHTYRRRIRKGEK